MVYFDNQATTPIDPRVSSALSESLSKVGNPASEHGAGWDAANRLSRSRDQLAKFIGCDASEVFFTSGATEANNIAVLGGALSSPPDRRRLLVSAIEHKSVLEAAEAAKNHGYSVEQIAVSKDGIIEPAAVERMLDDSVALVAVMAVNNEIGTIQPIQELGRRVQTCGAQFHVDATQAPAAMPIDVREWLADTISLSSHKIYGPGGVGMLFVAGNAPWRPRALLFGGGQEDGLRPGTVPTALCEAFAEATRIIEAEGPMERIRIASLRDNLSGRLQKIYPALIVTSSNVERHPGCLHVRFPGIDAADLLLRLQPGLAASTGSACSSGIIGPSHVVLALGYSAQAADECLRFSLGRFSTEEDLSAAEELISAAIEQGRSVGRDQRGRHSAN